MNDSDRRRSPDGFDDDAIFADIVARLKDEDSARDPERAARPATWEGPGSQGPGNQGPGSQGPGSLGPGSEAPAGPGEETEEGTAQQSAEEPARDPGEPLAVPAPQGWRAHQVGEDEEDEHFEPPPVTPLPVGDLQFWAILAGMIGGPLLLVYLVFLNRNLSSYWTLTAIAMSVGGFVLLVSRLPGRDGDDDNGARL